MQINERGQNVLNNIPDGPIRNLLSRLLVVNPQERISWDEYFQHEFFN